MAVIASVKRKLSIELCLRVTSALQTAGASAHRLEESVAQLAYALGLQVSTMAVPTGVMIAFDSDGFSTILRVPVERHNLTTLIALLRLVHLICKEESPDPVAWLEELDAILAAPPTWAPWMRVVAFMVAGGVFTILLGGGWRESVVGLAVGLSTGLNAVFGDRLHRLRRMPELIASLMGSLIANVGALLLGCSSFLPMLGGLLFALPGVTFVIGLAELANRSLLAGTARLASAFVGFMFVVFGAAMGERLARLGVADQLLVDPISLPGWVPYALLPVAGAAVAVYMRARKQDAPWVIACCFISYCVAKMTGAGSAHDWAATFAGALAAGLFGNLYARATKGPSVAMLVCGIYLLGPASLGLRGLQALFGGDTMSGIELGFQMALRGMGLVAGLMFASLLVPPPAPETRKKEASRELWHSDRL